MLLETELVVSERSPFHIQLTWYLYQQVTPSPTQQHLCNCCCPQRDCYWLITGRNKVVAKVIFLHLFVILFRGGMSASVPAGIPHPPGADPSPEQTPPRSRPPRADTPPGSRHPQAEPPLKQTPPPPRADTPQADTPPPGSTLRHTVNERPVRILLKCILVTWYFYPQVTPSPTQQLLCYCCYPQTGCYWLITWY